VRSLEILMDWAPNNRITTLQINIHVALGLGAADQDVALGGWIKRFGLVGDAS
jgi:hypothetical protein